MNLGEFSRGGKARGKEAVKALDHDMSRKQKMIPFGILNLTGETLHIVYGQSGKTSDFICDAIEQWWTSIKAQQPVVDEIVIYADNGPESSSHRTQFLFRLTAFARRESIRVHLVYYPPYHSKYNPIERCWAFLEKHWNGALPDTTNTVVEWTKTMTWKAVNPVVHVLNGHYPKRVRPTPEEIEAMQPFITRHAELAKWDVVIAPEVGFY